jgi:uncharacterized repeat protein (TIGR03943 family)
MTSTSLRAAGLALWGLVLLRAASDGRLALLLRDVFHPLVSLAGIVLLMLAVAMLLPYRRQCTASGPARRRDWLTLAASTLIALLLILVPPNPSFADLAQQRPVDNTAEAELSFVLPPAQRSLTDWVRLLRSQADPRLFSGEPAAISGFVLPRDGGQPVLARLLVRCCLADATPIGLAVRWPKDRPLPKRDQWLQVEGVMAVQAGPQGEELVLLPRRIQPIPRPQRPLEP